MIKKAPYNFIYLFIFSKNTLRILKNLDFFSKSSKMFETKKNKNS